MKGRNFQCVYHTRGGLNFFHGQKYTLEHRGFLGQYLCYHVPFMKKMFLKQKTQTYKGENTDTHSTYLCYGKCLQMTDWKNTCHITDRQTKG